jgi:hypothetical protein
MADVLRTPASNHKFRVRVSAKHSERGICRSHSSAVVSFGVVLDVSKVRGPLISVQGWTL